MSLDKPAASAATHDTPLDDFSQCHVGIIAHLDTLAELPALIGPAQRARAIATDMLTFFETVILEHHQEEESELFSAVMRSAHQGQEKNRIKAMVERLTREHREVEACWSRIKPQLKQIAKGHDTLLDTRALDQLVQTYRAHAQFEEAQFLPLSQTILGRDANHMAALGLSMHMRHSKPMPGYV